MFLAPSRSDLGESLLTTTLLRVYLREPAGKTPTDGYLNRIIESEISWVVGDALLKHLQETSQIAQLIKF